MTITPFEQRAKATVVWAGVGTETPCEFEGCTTPSVARAFIQEGGATRFSLRCCERHGRMLHWHGHKVADVIPHPYADRGARTPQDMLLLDVFDAPDGVVFEEWWTAWCAGDTPVHDFPEPILVGADGRLRFHEVPDE